MKRCLECEREIVGSTWECTKCGFAPERDQGCCVFSPEVAAWEENISIEHFINVSKIEPTNFWYTSRNRLIVWAFKKFFPNAKSYFEIGCGSGYVLSAIETAAPHLSLFGSDGSLGALNIARSRVREAELFQMDARKIPYTNEFDVITAFDLLEHVGDDESVLSEMYRATKKGGGVIITVPQHKFLWSAMDDYSHHVRRYERSELREKVERAGFKVQKVTGFVSLLLPLMALTRVAERKKKIEEDRQLPKGLEVKGMVNKILEDVMSLERVAIRAGVSFPMGGSQLLVARKL